MHARLWFALVLLVVCPPAVVHAQGVGIFSRPDCTAITSPVVGQTFCFDQTANKLKVWNGTVWLPAPLEAFAKVSLPTAGNAGRLVRVTDNERGLWMEDGTQWISTFGRAIDVQWYGAKVDGQAVFDASITNGQKTLTSASAKFQSTDV